MLRVRRNPLYGRMTIICDSNEDAHAQEYAGTNYWCSTEYNGNNSWNVNFSTGNTNNNNKYNTNRVRPAVAYGEDFDRFVESVEDAFVDCLKGKMSSKQAVEYLQIAKDDIIVLAGEMWTMTYKPTTSTCFLVKYPKIREVFAANFRDRIVHHWICLRLNPLFEERFISQGNVSHNCRVGFGTRTAVQSAIDGMERVSENYNKSAYVFKGDIVSFFMSMDQDVLHYLLSRFSERQYQGEYKAILMYLIKVVVYHRPEKDCIFNSSYSLWIKLDENKSMLRNGAKKGGPIGNLTTQLFANFMMSFFDIYVQFIMRRYNYHYVRFVDDFLLIAETKEIINMAIIKMETFLMSVLKLEMHKDKRYIQPVSHGVLFVGSMIKPHRVYLSNRTLARFREKVHGYNRLMQEKELTILDCKRIQSVINSYLGFCRNKNEYNNRKKILMEFSHDFYKYFYIAGHYDKIVIKHQYKEIKNGL
ncbi:MAG: reverse transcriptase domain-containing protein [Parabacteroides sp.]